jgi:hypothetical protein
MLRQSAIMLGITVHKGQLKRILSCLCSFIRKKEHFAKITHKYTTQTNSHKSLNHHHQPINVPTAGAQAFPMDYTRERGITHHAGPVWVGGSLHSIKQSLPAVCPYA